MNIKPISIVIKEMLAKINKRCWYTFISAFIIGLIAHGFVIANRIMYHDDAISIFGLGSTLESERYTLEVLRRVIDFFTHNTSTAWFNGIISLAFLSIFAVFVVELLDIKSQLMAVLVAGSLVAFPSVASVFAYMFTAPAYFLALPVIAVGVWFAQKTKLWSIICGAICIAFSLGDYQAYSAVYAVLVLMLLLKVLFQNEKEMVFFWKLLVSYATSFLLGVVIYVAGNKILVYLSGAYNKYDSKDISKLPKAIVNSYIAFGQIFISDSIGTAPYRMMRVGYGVLLILSIILFVNLFIRITDRNIVRRIFAIIIFLLLPIAINLVYVLTLEDVEIHSLMVYGLVFVMIIPIAFYEWIASRTEYEKNIKFINIISWMLTIVLGCNIFMCCKADNVAYQSAYFSQKQTMVYYSTLISRIQQIEGYDERMPVAFLNFEKLDDKNMPNNDEFQVSLTTLKSGMQEVASDYAYKGFMKYQCGFEPEWATDTTMHNLLELENVKHMNNYPNAGSIAIIDNVVVVKFADSIEN